MCIPNAMSRATGYFVDANVGGSLDNRDAIITSANGRFGYSHIVGMANMNAISVWAISRRNDLDTMHFHVLAAIYDNVVQLAI